MVMIMVMMMMQVLLSSKFCVTTQKLCCNISWKF